MPDPHERIISLYEEHAAAWDELRGPVLHENERPWIERFAAEVRPGGHVLDLGCGGGAPIASYLTAAGFRLTGLDSSPGLIALCRERLPAHEWLAGDMRELGLNCRFDGLLAWYSVFHLTFADQRAMFPRFAAHAAPGAPLLFAAGPQHGEALGEWQSEPLYHASLAPDEYRRLLDENGFDLILFRPGEPVAPGPSVWLARKR
jgi:trans-aconitate methyltransferase